MDNSEEGILKGLLKNDFRRIEPNIGKWNQNCVKPLGTIMI
jgi:hypothetical protein